MFSVKRIIFKANEDYIIPYNKEEYILACTYKNIERINIKKGEFIHNVGYRLENKHKYKCFTLIPYIDRMQYKNGKYFVRRGSDLVLEVRGLTKIVDLTVEAYSEFQILDIKGRSFILDRIEDVEVTDLDNEKILFETKTPVITTTKDSQGKTRYVPLRAIDKFYYNMWNNLLRKYKLIYNEDFEGEINISPPHEDWIKSKEIFTKGFKQIGYKFRFEVTTNNKKIKNIIYYLGLGEKNAYGYGQVKIKEVIS